MSSSSSNPPACPADARLPLHLQGPADLAAERKRASFSVDELTQHLDGGAEKTARRRRLRALIQDDPVFANDDRYYATREERYRRALAQGARVMQLVSSGAIGDLEVREDLPVLLDAVGEMVPTSLHTGMFLPTLLAQCDAEQAMRWLPPAMNLQIIGCYAQTELGHGSNVQGLETTATFDAARDEFVMHSPTITATKWWPGGLGKTANFAVVHARLLVGGTDHGVHTFMVQLRSLEDHRALPGVLLGDIGDKMGSNANDNGWLRFDQHRIPRTHLLAKFARVERDGSYVRPPHKKLGYGTMMLVRSNLVALSATYLSKAVTVAVRYSAVRRQFGTSTDVLVDDSNAASLAASSDSAPASGAAPRRRLELQVLDYSSQQFRLMPLVAAAYAFRATATFMLELHKRTDSLVQAGDFSLLAETHATSSGLKAMVTNYTQSAIEECRRCCGGHGYLRSSGLPDLYVDHMVAQTAEGDNWLLTQQTGKYLLKALKAARAAARGDADDTPSSSSEAGDRLPYLQDHLARTQKHRRHSSSSSSSSSSKSPTWNVHRVADLFDSANQLQLFSHRAARMIVDVGRLLDDRTTATFGGDFESAWNTCLVEVFHTSKAHCQRMVLSCFQQSLQRLRDERGANSRVVRVLKRLCDLYALHTIAADGGDFLLDGFVTPTQMRMVHAAIRKVLTLLRPDAVALVDAFDYSDHDLNSALGANDGRVYERLFEHARNHPFNKTDVLTRPYEETIAPLCRQTKL